MTQFLAGVAVLTATCAHVPIRLEPLHAHDCDCCKFLGWAGHELDGEQVDVYLHEAGRQEEEDTLILRTGDQGPDYHSLPLRAACQIPRAVWREGSALAQAWRRAGSPAEWAGLAQVAA